MNYAQQQRDPRRHLFGIASVILIHVVVIYALMNGLARKVVDVLKKPLDVSIIEEVKPDIPPPPPPTKVLQPPPKFAPPPPAYVPPPEVQVAPQPNTVTAVTHAPPPPPTPASVAEAPKPAIASVGIVCPNHLDVQSRVAFPAQAMRLGLNGEVEVEFLVSPSGSISDITIARSSNKLFNSAVTAAVAQFRCVGQGSPVKVRVPFVFRLE